jgi:hypothetical protein
MIFLRVSVEEIIVLYHLFDQLVLEMESKEDFDRKYGAWLITCFALLNKINPQAYPYQVPESEKAIWIRELQPYLPSERALLSWKNNPINRDSFKVTLDLQLRARRPSSYKIGKGYTDKGSARNPAEDSSPRWQDVAQTEVPNSPRKSPHDAHVRDHARVHAQTRIGKVFEQKFSS